ncbi:hypothetical protein T11_13440 [Trichinella zimbabwensis]|uniref:Uncharacterized protein n=1 Tax=Trichinella zimbabwensis TaxID=268475 RepID=A0A0V1GJL7_9BILA|nr:hypothetical protein T11_13440 [Trichinella zimbabwensis]
MEAVDQVSIPSTEQVSIETVDQVSIPSLNQVSIETVDQPRATPQA